MTEPHNQRCDNDCIYFGEADVHEVNRELFKIIGRCRKTNDLINVSSKNVIDAIGCASYAPRRREYEPKKE